MSNQSWKIILEFIDKGFDLQRIECDQSTLEDLYSINGIPEHKLENELGQYLKNYKSELKNWILTSTNNSILIDELKEDNACLKSFLVKLNRDHPEKKYPFTTTKEDIPGIKYYDASGTIPSDIKKSKFYNGRFKNGELKDGNFIEFTRKAQVHKPLKNYLIVKYLSTIKKFVNDIMQLNELTIDKFQTKLFNKTPFGLPLSESTSNNSTTALGEKLSSKMELKIKTHSFFYDPNKIDNVKKCFEALVEGKFIIPTGSNYYVKVFRPVFTNKLISQKIKWNGDLIDLYKLIKKCKKVLGTKQIWKITSKCFLDENGEIILPDKISHTHPETMNTTGHLSKAIDCLLSK